MLDSKGISFTCIVFGHLRVHIQNERTVSITAILISSNLIVISLLLSLLGLVILVGTLVPIYLSITISQ